MAEPVCSICGGTGWRIVERDGVSAADKCECSGATASRRRFDRSGIPPKFGSASFENFSLLQDNPIAHRSIMPVFMAVRKYAREFPMAEKPGLLLIGETGTGKTHLAVAALLSLIGRGFEGRFFDFNELIDKIRNSYVADSSASDRAAYSQAMESEILLLDDLGAHRVKDFVQDVLTSIISYRYNNNKPLIATTNLPDADAGYAMTKRTVGNSGPEVRMTLAENIGMRARSRLFEMCQVIRMPDVEDYRLRRR
jgi:DNA replication protein DnaC